MEIESYAGPVSELLSRGEPPVTFDDAALASYEGFGPEHVPELIRLATDDELIFEEEPVAGWAPIHAIRVLGRLRSPEAAEPLFNLLQIADDNDLEWYREDLHKTLVMIGPPVLPFAIALMRDENASYVQRIAAAELVGSIGKQNADFAPECVQAVAEELEKFEGKDYTFNAFLVGALIDMKAVETAPLIERVYQARAVNEMMFGRWPTVQYELGLLDEEPPRIPWTREEQERFFPSRPMHVVAPTYDLAWDMTPEQRADLAKRRNAERKKQKQKAKQAKAQRKQQRRRR